MKIKILLKDSLVCREYEAHSFWEGNNTFYIRLKNNTVHVYPMQHIWRLELPSNSLKKISVIKER